jgi:hypothetical protein
MAMKIFKSISAYFGYEPLLAYILVVSFLGVCEFLNSIISLFPIEVLFLIGVLRAYVAFKIVKYLKKTFPMIEQKEGLVKINAVYKKAYKVAIIAYSVLFIVCSVDVASSAVSAICGLYANVPLYLICLALEYILDVVGITCLFMAHLNSETTFRIEPWWIISNIVIILCSVDAFLSMLGIHEMTFKVTTFLFYVFTTVFWAMRVMYAFRIQDEIALIAIKETNG